MAILVKSHVARDFLQNAAFFNTVAKIAWEYVSNSLDNPRGNQSVHCRVQIGDGRIVVTDDARGMSHRDLERFFTMHGENVQRAAGKVVRGRFGTGKSAAFGLANTLRVSSVKDGLKNVVELWREDIVAARDGSPFEVRELVTTLPTNEPAGTMIEIEGVQTKPGDILQTKQYVERRLGRYRQANHVMINNHVAEYQEPPFIDERTFSTTSAPVGSDGAPVVLTVRTSPVPLDEGTRGIDILSRGIWHETTLAGLDRSELIEHLYGFVDIPALEDDSGPIPPFDNTRSGRLNPANAIVVATYAWLATCLDDVRRNLLERDRERRRTAEAKRLQQEADRIARILNQDFDDWRVEFKRAAGSLGRDLGHVVGLGDGAAEVLPGEGDEAADFVMTGPPHGEGSSQGGPAGAGDVMRPGSGLKPGPGTGRPRGGEGSERRARSGGFALEYENATEAEARSRYEEDRRAIYINLDHPQIAAARRGGIDSRPFRQLSYEVAFTEYSLAVAREMARAQGAIFDAQDAIVEIGLVLNRISRQGSFLYDDSGA